MPNRPPSGELVQWLRKTYPEGTRVELVSIDDPHARLRPGDRGTVSFVDDAGTLHARWDSDAAQGIACGTGRVRKIDPIPVRDTSVMESYETGTDCWRAMVVRDGVEEALAACGRYLDARLRSARPEPEDEKQFCRALFEAMFDTAARKTDPAKLVYPCDVQTAGERSETPLYHASRKRDAECGEAIDAAVQAPCREADRDSLEFAAMKLVHDFGFARVNLILARNIQWVRESAPPGNAAVLLHGLADHMRKLYGDVGAERFALPGRPESGEVVRGYEIERSVVFDSRCGFAIGRNPEAASPFACWEFTVREDGTRSFYGSHCTDDFQSAADLYTVCTLEHMSGVQAREIPNPFAAAEAGAGWDENQAMDLLPGQPVSGREVEGYQVRRAVLFGDDAGFALAEKPDEQQPFVVWQFYLNGDMLVYHWLHGMGTQAEAMRQYQDVAEYHTKECAANVVDLPSTWVGMTHGADRSVGDAPRGSREKPSVLQQIREPRGDDTPKRPKDKGGPEL